MLVRVISVKTTDNSAKTAAVADQKNWLEIVRSQVASPRFGLLQIDGRDSDAVQIERAGKVRLDKQPMKNT